MQRHNARPIIDTLRILAVFTIIGAAIVYFIAITKYGGGLGALFYLVWGALGAVALFAWASIIHLLAEIRDAALGGPAPKPDAG